SWMMGMQIESPTEESLTIDGYDVAIDDNVVNTEKLTATSYAQKMTDSGSHSLRVNTWYPGVSQSVKGEKRTFTIGLTGINNVAIDGNIHLKQGTDYLQIEGKGVQSVTIFNASGAIAAKVIGSKVDISSLPTGIYLVQIQTINGNVTRRIAVEK
ncbi:MAG: T9SS type A sorting domain-containing protein, partial [Bacteroidaceae bacterium]|nr:T9SS type A sorting domain-containing protein [Bacteroidaceae bacterium]